MSRENGLQVVRVISGGQTGVDRGALDAAIWLGLEHGGWCPRGRLAEDGRIPEQYELKETRSFEYKVRTEKNVLDADATLILYRDALRGGTEYTRRMAIKHGRPYYAIDLDKVIDSESDTAVGEVRRWLVAHDIQTLNVAGPRESSSPGIEEAARALLVRLLGDEQ